MRVNGLWGWWSVRYLFIYFFELFKLDSFGFS